MAHSRTVRTVTADQIAKVKDELPNQKIRMPDGNTYDALLSGRKNLYCKVTVLRYHGLEASYEINWEAITRVVLSGDPLWWSA